jgi:hypothetical protein
MTRATIIEPTSERPEIDFGDATRLSALQAALKTNASFSAAVSLSSACFFVF